MKTIFALSLVLVSQAALADGYERTCLNRYRDATLSLVDSTRSFNEGGSSAPQYIAEFGMIESTIGATRLMCAMEPESIKECVRLYKKQYHKIRDNIDLIEIANGNQTRVKIGLAEAGILTTDLRCQ